MSYRTRTYMWPVTEAYLMGWNDTNLFIRRTYLCMSIKARISHLLKAVVGLFWNLFSASSDIQGSHLLHCACYLTLLLKYIQGRNTAELFFGLKKFHIFRETRFQEKHLLTWNSRHLIG